MYQQGSSGNTTTLFDELHQPALMVGTTTLPPAPVSLLVVHA